MLKYSFALIIAMLILVVSIYAHVGDEDDTGAETPIHKHVVASTLENDELPLHVRDMSDGEVVQTVIDGEIVDTKQHGHNNTWHHHHSEEAYLATDAQHNNATFVPRQGPREVEVERGDKLIISRLVVEEEGDRRKISFILTANTDDVIFNHLSIHVDGYQFGTIYQFFGTE